LNCFRFKSNGGFCIRVVELPGYHSPLSSLLPPRVSLTVFPFISDWTFGITLSLGPLHLSSPLRPLKFWWPAYFPPTE
jgi:hypothetical protein